MYDFKADGDTKLTGVKKKDIKIKQCKGNILRWRLSFSEHNGIKRS